MIVPRGYDCVYVPVVVQLLEALTQCRGGGHGEGLGQGKQVADGGAGNGAQGLAALSHRVQHIRLWGVHTQRQLA